MIPTQAQKPVASRWVALPMLWLVGQMLLIRRTHPWKLLDWTLGPLLYILWEPFSRKRSHFWRWIDISDVTLVPRVTLKITGLSSVRARKNLWDELVLDNFRWDIVERLEVRTPGGARYNGDYQIGFVAQEYRLKRQFCTLVLNGRIGVLHSAYDTDYFAWDMDGNPLQLVHIGTTTKRDLPKDETLV